MTGSLSKAPVLLSYKEYQELLRCKRKLSALEAGGVDNWEWYSESLERYLTDEESNAD